MVKVKVCGITNKDDALAAAGYGCDAVGFVFYKKSPRYVSPEQAARIISALPQRVLKAGVFVNSRESSVRSIARECRLDILQFHGGQSPEFCRRFKGFKVVKVFRVKDKIDRALVRRYRTWAYMFDKLSRKGFGGTGSTIEWERLAGQLRGLGKPVFLAGGLDDKNLARAVRAVNPEWVDASSRLELSPGIKDVRKLGRFITGAKRCRHSLKRRRQ